MAKYIIEGGKKLIGKVTLSGNKNSILPCMAAALLTSEEVTLGNVPQILDVEVMIQIFETLGVKVERGDHTLIICSKDIKKRALPEELTNKLRASVLLIGPLLSRFGKVELFHPGGDVIGKRSIHVHLEALKKLGFNYSVKDNHYKIWGAVNKNNNSIFFDEASVTGTENLLLASSLTSAKIVLKNCAVEPHVVDLCNLLIKMGVNIEGAGTSTLTIHGQKRLEGARFEIGCDSTEFGTFAIAAAITGGQIEIENCQIEGLEPIVKHFEKMGIFFKEENSSIKISAKHIVAIPKIHTNIWPGFPTDVMSLVIVLATQAKGITLCHDWMYETRMYFTDKLISMGANITLADPHRVLVYGPCKLYGRNLETPDIRAGMALVLAALVSKGISVINRAELIERGYENVVEKLSSLGANIQRID